jgi:hypothetical protein
MEMYWFVVRRRCAPVAVRKLACEKTMGVVMLRMPRLSKSSGVLSTVFILQKGLASFFPFLCSEAYFCFGAVSLKKKRERKTFEGRRGRKENEGKRRKSKEKKDEKKDEKRDEKGRKKKKGRNRKTIWQKDRVNKEKNRK